MACAIRCSAIRVFIPSWYATPPMSAVLPRRFYEKSTLQVARGLLGARLVRFEKGRRLSGFIVETEAYIGESDLGCHAKAGLTARTAVMYGPAGRAYVYFTYGNHWMLNVVTLARGFPAAVLVRAILPDEGAALISRRRHGRDTFGPGKLTQALAITGLQNGLNLAKRDSGLWIERGRHISASRIIRGPRVGLDSVPEPWKSKPWRFLVSDWGLNLV
jgi:DNA-3-methyladenine glycosylase